MNIPEFVPFKEAFTKAFEKQFGVELNDTTINELKQKYGGKHFHFMIHYGDIFFSVTKVMKHKWDDEYTHFEITVHDVGRTWCDRYPDIKTNRQSVISMKGLDNICKFADDVRKKYAEKYVAAMYGDTNDLEV